MIRGVGLLFSGQGAQVVGMGRSLAERDPEIRALYERGSEAAGLDLARLSFEGPEQELRRTDVCQPAIVLASLAAWRTLRTCAPELEPAMAAGLSLGEYTALAVAGAIDPIDAVRLVAARGRFMQQACDARPGAMASVLGLAPEQVEEVVAELSSAEAPLVVSNYNSPRQTVISGAAEAVERAIEPLRARGARRVVPLRVAGAYHSPLMAPAAERLAEQLEQVEIRAPRWPVFSNVTGAPHGEPDEIRRLLAEQVCRPVRWTDSMRGMREAGLEQFYELGPGRALAGMLRQIDRGAKCASLMEWEDFERMGWTWPAGSI